MTGLIIGFILGWAACVAFIWLMESEDFEPFDEPHGDVVPWPTDFERPHSSFPTSERQQEHA